MRVICRNQPNQQQPTGDRYRYSNDGIAALRATPFARTQAWRSENVTPPRAAHAWLGHRAQDCKEEPSQQGPRGQRG
eukprot:202061-Chlamydomonas_euryale.AAC.7